jgi:hypothetical protein
MKLDIGFFCKSFSDDFILLEKLIDSFEMFMGKYSIDISIPIKDKKMFFDIIGNRDCINLFFDEDYIENEAGRLDGWRQQQVAKLCSYRIATSKRYLALDSDMRFYRQLNEQDFPIDNHEVLTASTLWAVAGDFLNSNLDDYIINKGHFKLEFPSHPSSSFDLDKSNYDAWLSKSKELSTAEQSTIINKLFGENRWFFYQPGQTLIKDALLNFHNDLKSRGLDFTKIIELAPWEFNWYGEWFVSQYADDITYQQSRVLHFQTSDAINKYVTQYGRDALIEIFPIMAFAARHYDLNELVPD